MIPQRRDQVRSDEEWAVVLWLRESVRENLVRCWEYEPQTFELIPAKTYQTVVGTLKNGDAKFKTKSLHQSLTYTPDFRIVFSGYGVDLLGSYFEKALFAGEAFIDVKGAMDIYHDAKQFSVVQKVMFDKKAIWVQKVIPYAKNKKNSLFIQTFAPAELRRKKNGDPNACSFRCRSIEEFLNK